VRIGVALGSGGARGWSHIGSLRALAEIGIRPDVVSGCSMGAVVGAAWAADRLDEMEAWARALTRQKFLGYVDLRLTGGGLVGGRAVAEMLGEMGVPDRFDTLKRRMIVVATDMATGHEIWLQEGELLEAVRASIAIPGIFSPHRLNGKWLLDGGLVNPVPASACRALGADVTIALNPNGRHGRKLWSPDDASDSFFARLTEPDFLDQLPAPVRGLWPKSDPEPRSPHYFDVVSTSIDIMTDFMRKTRAASDPPHLTLEADLRHMSMLELFRADEAIAEGRRIVMENADALRRLVETA
jgi:NTE family protein